MLPCSTTRSHTWLGVCPGQLEWDLFSAVHLSFYFRNQKAYHFLLASSVALRSLWPVSMVTVRTGGNIWMPHRAALPAAVRKGSRQKDFMDIYSSNLLEVRSALQRWREKRESKAKHKVITKRGKKVLKTDHKTEKLIGVVRGKDVNNL